MSYDDTGGGARLAAVVFWACCVGLALVILGKLATPSAPPLGAARVCIYHPGEGYAVCPPEQDTLLPMAWYRDVQRERDVAAAEASRWRDSAITLTWRRLQK